MTEFATHFTERLRPIRFASAVKSASVRRSAPAPYRVRLTAVAWAAVVIGGSAFAAEPPPNQAKPPTATESAPEGPTTDELYEFGQQLFETLAPAEIKAEYEFPSKEQWNAYVAQIQTALKGDSLEALAEYAPQGRAALAAMRMLGTDPELAAWLEQRLDEIEAAREVSQSAPPLPPVPSPPGPSPLPEGAPPPPAPPDASPEVAIPHYDVWVNRVRGRPVPSRAADLMPTLREAFTAERVPPELAWLAEAESSFNPEARSPVGAKGLFQLMPATAKSLGLDTMLPDERTDPEKSARAAARYLRYLHGRFRSWPLALAAYNAGEGRVSRALAKQSNKTFAEIAETLPSETRMYVPKVCALVAVRSGTPVSRL